MIKFYMTIEVWCPGNSGAPNNAITLSRSVEWPVAPHEGMLIDLKDNQGDHFTVKSVWHYIDEGWIQAFLEDVKCGSIDDVKETEAWLREIGWAKPSIVLPDEVAKNKTDRPSN